ncbi:MAG TPA: HPP family protein [Pseudonocardiaceae bacterium]
MAMPHPPGPPSAEQRNADPDSVTGRMDNALGQIGIGIVGFVGSVVTMTVLGALAWATRLPWLFPSLAPTTLLMFETPMHPQASPRNALVGHGVATAVGFGSLVVFGLQHTGPVTEVGTTPARVAATALALGVTTLLLNVFGTPHPPAAATVLIISLGLMHTTAELEMMAVAVLLMVMLAWGLNRLGGVRTTFTPHPWPPQRAEQEIAADENARPGGGGDRRQRRDRAGRRPRLRCARRADRAAGPR